MECFISSYDTTAERTAPFAAAQVSHDFCEIYCFLEGDAAYCVEGTRYLLKPGDVVVIGKGEVHRVELLSRQRYRRMGVHFDPSALPEALCPDRLLAPFRDRPSGQWNHYPARLFPGSHWTVYLQQLVRQDTPQAALCCLQPLLLELAQCFPVLQAAGLAVETDPAAPMMNYINHHLTDKLSLEELARQFSLSQTHLNRLFRRSAGTTVWEYVTLKRLALARELLGRGILPTQVCEQCGFGDYSSFFRAYKSHFGTAPSTHTAKRN